MISYYKQKIIIAKCDKKGNILGPIERWEAHEEGILHRAFTVAIFYKGKLLVQHRKHPVFDSVFDVTASSHQIFDGKNLQDTIEATHLCLKREWNILSKDLKTIPKDLGTIYYKAKDKFSIYVEHEICNVVVCEVNRLPEINFEVSYGYSLASIQELSNSTSRLHQNLAPWVKVMIDQKLL